MTYPLNRPPKANWSTAGKNGASAVQNRPRRVPAIIVLRSKMQALAIARYEKSRIFENHKSTCRKIIASRVNPAISVMGEMYRSYHAMSSSVSLGSLGRTISIMFYIQAGVRKFRRSDFQAERARKRGTRGGLHMRDCLPKLCVRRIHGAERGGAPRDERQHEQYLT